MLISYNWLKDYVDLKLPPEKLAELLTMAGLSVESTEKKADDHILEIEITANRPDWLSYIGVAREVAALTGRKLKIPYSVQCTAYSEKLNVRNAVRSTQDAVRINVDDKALCPRYTGRVIRNVKVGDSPAWLKDKLVVMGLRPVNNIVDITNFCLFETGEPMHAFDLDKIAGGEIIVRRARKGEKISAIDGVERELDDSILVIADSERPVAIAGIMGGLKTEVTFSTTNILLEAAYFDPISVRRSSRKLALSTESSYRFERRVDINNIEYASDRAASLINEVAHGASSAIIDIGRAPAKGGEVSLKYSRLNKILGVGIPPSKAKSILTSLGMKAKAAPGGVKCVVPSHRYDIKDEVDLIEEIARVYGYGNIPSTIPAVTDIGERVTRGMTVEKLTGDILAAMGFEEVYTYSLLSRKQLSAASAGEGRAIEIRNPLSGEQEVMRTTLIPGMANAILWNLNRKSGGLKFFEAGNTYLKEGADKFSERRKLAITLTGVTDQAWNAPPRPYNFFDLKGAVESLSARLGITGLSFKETPDGIFLANASAAIEVGGKRIGVMGELSNEFLQSFDIKERVYALELDMGLFAEAAKLDKRFKGIDRYPSVMRDISIIIEEGVKNAAILDIIKEKGTGLLKNAQLIDRYKGKQIPDGKIGLTYRLEYTDPGRTLEEKDVSGLHAGIISALETSFGAKLR